MRTELGKGFPRSDTFFLVAMSLGDPFWYFLGGVNWGRRFWRLGGIEIQIWAGIHLFGGIFCVIIDAGGLLWA